MTKIAAIIMMARFFSSVEKVILTEDCSQNLSFMGRNKQNEFTKTTQTSLLKRTIETDVPSIPPRYSVSNVPSHKLDQS